MKFKAIFFIFNGIILFSFLLIFFMPLFVLGADYAMVFWGDSWYLLALFLGVLGILDGYFLYNWTLFTSLEKENWKGLHDYLKEKLFEKNRFSRQNINLFVNASLMLNDTESIDSLFQHVAQKAPEKAEKYALNLGIPVLLRHQDKEIVDRFGPVWNKSKQDLWVGWNYAFGLLLGGTEEGRQNAKEILTTLLDRMGNDYPLGLLSSYMLKTFDDGDTTQKVEAFLQQLNRKFTQDSWSRSMQKAQEKIQVYILGSILQEAAKWAFSPEKSNQLP